MRLSSIGVGSPHCMYPLYPESFLIRADEDIVVVGCPFRALELLAKYRKDPLDVDMWIVTDCSINMISGLERVAKLALYAGVKPLLAVPPPLAEALNFSLAPSLPGPLSKYFNVHVTSGVEIKEEDGWKETIRLLPHPNQPKQKSYGLLFERAEVFISGRGAFDHKWVRYYGEGCRALLMNACMDEMAWSSQFHDLSQNLADLSHKTLWYGMSRPRTKDDFQIGRTLEANDCIFDSISGYCVVNKKPPRKREGSVLVKF